MASPVYVTVLRLQEPEITAHCFGDCGKAILASLIDEQLGALMPCRETNCPHLDKQMDEALWTDAGGDPVFLRRLTPLPANAE